MYNDHHRTCLTVIVCMHVSGIEMCTKIDLERHKKQIFSWGSMPQTSYIIISSITVLCFVVGG